MKPSEYYKREVEFEQVQVGKKIVSVTQHGDSVRQTFDDGSYFQRLISLPIDHHKLAILVKALELATEDGNSLASDCGREPLGHSPVLYTMNHWINLALQHLQDKVKWRVLDQSINWPEWLLELEKEQLKEPNDKL